MYCRLQDEEIRRQDLEDTEVDIKQEEVRRLIMDYMVRGAPFSRVGWFVFAILGIHTYIHTMSTAVPFLCMSL